MRSIALCRAVWMIQARGDSGISEVRHCSTAAVNASCTASSASSKSPVSRIRVARIRPQSDRQTASRASSGDMPDFKYFWTMCRFGLRPFDLLTEVSKMKYMLLIYDEEQSFGK